MQQPWQKCTKGKPGELPGIAVAGPHAHLTHLLFFPQALCLVFHLLACGEGGGLPGSAHPIKPMSLLQELRVPPMLSLNSLFGLSQDTGKG